MHRLLDEETHGNAPRDKALDEGSMVGIGTM